MKLPESGSHGGPSSQGADGWWTSLAKEAAKQTSKVLSSGVRRSREPDTAGEGSNGRASLLPHSVPKQQTESRERRNRRGMGNPSPERSSNSSKCIIFLACFPTANSTKLPPALLCPGLLVGQTLKHSPIHNLPCAYICVTAAMNSISSVLQETNVMAMYKLINVIGY